MNSEILIVSRYSVLVSDHRDLIGPHKSASVLYSERD